MASDRPGKRLPLDPEPRSGPAQQPQTAGIFQQFQTYSALRYSNFRWFWLNGANQAMAQGMQFLILGWLVLDITNSSSQLGLASSLLVFPTSSSRFSAVSSPTAPVD